MIHFWGVLDWGFMKEGVKAYLRTPKSPLNSPTFSLSSRLYWGVFQACTWQNCISFSSRSFPAHSRIVLLFAVWLLWKKKNKNKKLFCAIALFTSPCTNVSRHDPLCLAALFVDPRLHTKTWQSHRPTTHRDLPVSSKHFGVTVKSNTAVIFSLDNKFQF
jgi:hypothetical protein